MLHIVLWKWNQPGFRETYTHDHVNALAKAVRKHINGTPHRIVCVTDDAGKIDESVDVHPLWKDHNTTPNASGARFPSCYRRLKLFDPQTQREMKIAKDDRVMSLDLDTLITGDLKPIVTRKERFVGWAVRGTRHIRVFNGSMFMFSAGDFQEIWSTFNPLTSPTKALTSGYFGSDQGWLSLNLSQRTDCAGWHFPQVASFPRELQRRPALPNGVTIACFHGKKKPWHADVQREAPWIKQHYLFNQKDA